MKTLVLLIVVVTTVALSAGQSLAAGLNDYKFLRIAAQDQRAVMQTPKGKLQLIKVGDVIAEEAEIVEIAEGRIVLSRHDSQGEETVIVRLNGNKQRIERIRNSSSSQPAMPATVRPAERSTD